MDKDQMNEVFQGIVDDKFNNVVGKVVEKDGKYVFEGVAMNNRGKIIATITYVTGVFGVAYVVGKVSYKITEKIHNIIRKKRLQKAKAKAFDDMMNSLEEVLENHKDESQGKHAKNEESE